MFSSTHEHFILKAGTLWSENHSDHCPSSQRICYIRIAGFRLILDYSVFRMSLKRKNTEESDSQPSKRKRFRISTSRKREICMYKQSNPSASGNFMIDHFHEKWGIKLACSTLRTIISESEKWLSFETPKTNRFRIRRAKYSELEDVLYSWCIDARGRGGEFTNDELVQKAKDIAAEMGVTGLGYSNGWLYRFRRRYGLTLEKIRRSEDPSVMNPDLHKDCIHDPCDPLRNDTTLQLHKHQLNDTIQEPHRFKGHITIEESSVRSVDINSWNDSAESEDAQSGHIKCPQMITHDGEIKTEVLDEDYHNDSHGESAEPAQNYTEIGVIQYYGRGIKEEMINKADDIDLVVDTCEPHPLNIKEEFAQEEPDVEEDDVLISSEEAKASLRTVIRYLQQHSALIHRLDSTLTTQAAMDNYH